MGAATYNLAIEEGTDLLLGFTVDNGAAAAYDLTGCTIAAQIRDVPNGTLLRDLAVAITDAAAGEFSISLSAAQTVDLADGFWDLLLTRPDGKHLRLVQGSVRVSERVTIPA